MADIVPAKEAPATAEALSKTLIEAPYVVVRTPDGIEFDCIVTDVWPSSGRPRGSAPEALSFEARGTSAPRLSKG